MVTWLPRVEVAFGVPPATEPTADQWVSLPRRLTPGTSVSTGRRLGDGRASFELDDRDRELDPTNPNAAYQIAPMAHARILVDYAGTSYPLFRGYVERWSPVWVGPNIERLRVELVPATVWLALLEGSVALPAQRTDERVDALLDFAGWPASLRNIGPGVVQVEAYEQGDANLLRILDDTVDAEEGELFVGPDGVLTFGSRHARFDEPVTFEIGGNGPGYESASPSFGADRIVNISRTELATGETFEAVDSASRDAYGPRVGGVRDLPVSDVEAMALAVWQVYRQAEPSWTVDSVTVDAAVDGVLPTALGLRVGELVRFVRTGTVGPSVEMVGHVEQVRHQIGRQRMSTTLELSPYHGEGPWFALDDSLLDGPAKLAP